MSCESRRDGWFIGFPGNGLPGYCLASRRDEEIGTKLAYIGGLGRESETRYNRLEKSLVLQELLY